MSDKKNSEYDEQEQVVLRREKLNALRKIGQAYPNDFKITHFANKLHEAYGTLSDEALEKENASVKVAGRLMTRRLMGKASFVHLQDMSGRIQLYIARDLLSEGVYAAFKQWDLGDIVGVQGTVFKTKTGELSIKVKKIRLLTKALRPLPDKYHGLTNIEQRYRQRYLDLMTNTESRTVFALRSRLIQAIRDFLIERDFLEVETPMMHSVIGGAAARPFQTHHNALDMPLYLRIAPELFLKRLVVGGFERVFEINRNFRNEGISTRHNPEFTMLEFYMAYADYRDLMDLTEIMLRHLTQQLLGKTTLQYGDHTLDFSKSFERISVYDAVLKYCPNMTEDILTDKKKLSAFAKKAGVEVDDTMGLGKFQMALFEKYAEAYLIQPIFVTDFPTEVSPLARKNDQNPFVADRFELYIAGYEISNGFSELNDPDDQADRFEKQVQARKLGDLDAMEYDVDYVTALQYGLPPTAGEGIGIDRLVMIFTNAQSIRDVILFPLMRRK
jgi:lysyl-tRNA synthetase class 2